MKFGMIGAGRLSRAIARHAIKAGHEVVFSNSRGPETLTDLVDGLGPQASAGTAAEAGAADFVVLTVNWDRVGEAVRNLPSRQGRILIDATNQWKKPPPDSIVDELEVGGSEWVASLIPDARVIKAFDNLYAPKIADDPITDNGRRILFYAGDDQDSKDLFRDVIEGFGFAPVDLGPLHMGRLMQVDGPLTGLHAIRESVPHPVPQSTNNAVAPAGLAGTWTIDPAHSSINFSVRHLMVNRVRGTLGTFSGEITVSGENTASVSAEIGVGSVNTGNDDRDTHLRSAEFFDVEQYPTATFTATGVRQDVHDGYALDGDFTLKGTTKPITLGLQFTGINPGMGRGPVAGFQASVVLNRKDFGININMPLEGGGVVLGDEVTVDLDIEALKAA